MRKLFKKQYYLSKHRNSISFVEMQGQNHMITMIALLFLASIMTVSAFVPADRVSTLCQTQHGGFKSPWMDLSLHQMPKFQRPDSQLMQTTLPRPKDNEPEMKLNPSEDVKISFTFARNKLVVPVILLYDSKLRKSLMSLIVTFSHDDFDVLRLRYETVYGPPIQRLDPQHPSLTAFDLEYRWEAVQESDLRLGVVVMFVVTLLLLLFLIGYVSCTYDRDVGSINKPNISNSSRAAYSGGHRN